MDLNDMIPNEENLMLTLEKNIIGRNKDLVKFYELLTLTKKATSIAIDGKWGTGKTFFVKQLIMMINAKNGLNNMQNIERNGILDKISSINDVREINGNSLAVYYDAWGNDNNSDPILSLMYEMIQQLNAIFDNDISVDLFKLGLSIFELATGRSEAYLVK